jgi:peroxiredoxin
MKRFIFSIAVLALLCFSASAQNKFNGPVTPGQQMPSFSLPTYQGSDFNLDSYKGKNVVLIFLRGLVEKGHWCNICHYSYVQLADYESRMQLRKKYNTEFAFVLPYDKDTAKYWVSIFPEQLKVVEGWKNPAEPEKLSEGGKRWMEMARNLFPVKYEVDPKNIQTPFPIIIDADKSLSKGLGLFTMKFDKTEAPQNIPCVYIIDKSGKLVFKYLSQNTIDRPSYDYLITVFDKFLTK